MVGPADPKDGARAIVARYTSGQIEVGSKTASLYGAHKKRLSRLAGCSIGVNAISLRLPFSLTENSVMVIMVRK